MSQKEPTEHAYPLLEVEQRASPNDGLKPETDSSDRRSDGKIVVSKWGRGWKTITTMIFFYILAFATAVLHLGMFLVLHKKRTDDDSVPSQTHVAAISTLLVNVFGASLGLSLGVALTQYLWYLFRTRPISVGSIENLLGVQNEPLLLLTWSTWVAAPIAYVLATVILLLMVAKIFPPGALNVVSLDVIDKKAAHVPTFTANYTGNGSLADTNTHSLCDNTVQSSFWTCATLHPAARRIAYATLSTGEVLSADSSCGPNCTYSIVFEGPHLQCTKEVNKTVESLIKGTDEYSYYSAGFLGTYTQGPSVIDGNITYPTFFTNMSSPLGSTTSSSDIVSNTSYLACKPGVVTYELDVGFEDGVRNLSLSKRNDVRSLSELFVSNSRPPLPENEKSNWSKDQLSTLTAVNVYAIINSMVQALTGVYPMTVAGNSSAIGTITLSNGTTIEYYPNILRVFNPADGQSSEPINGTIVAATYLNKNRDSLSVTAEPDIEVTTDLLNEALENVTMSIILTLPLWNTTTKATRATSHNFYLFSNPVYLFVPYGSSLVVALPFLLLGIVALGRNGVPAMDGGWLQILMTTTASQRLHKLAAGGCLGGEDNVPGELKKTRVLFGEVVVSGEDASRSDAGTAEVRRAGFGLLDEIVPLRKRGRYGVTVE